MSDEKKIKIWNRSKGIHHFVFSDGIRKLPIAPEGFNLIPKEEVYYVDSTSKSFKKGILEIDPSEEEILVELGYTVKNPNTYTKEDLENFLTSNFTKQVKEKLSKITERHAIENLIDLARTMDLPNSKIEFIEELTGIKVYDDFVKELEKESKDNKK